LNLISCNGSIGSSDPVAIVRLPAAGTVLLDFADPAQPRMACRFQSLSVLQLIDAHHVVVGGEGSLYAVIELPGLSARWFQLPSGPSGPSNFIAVSPGLDSVFYSTDQVHLATKAGDDVVGTPPNPLGSGCGGPEESKQVAYARSGQHAFQVDQLRPNLNFLNVFNNLLVPTSQLSPPTHVQMWMTPDNSPEKQPWMPVWSPNSELLYYRVSGGVSIWTPEGSSVSASAGSAYRYLPGVSWYYPTVSADAKHLAYAVERSDGLHDVYLIDLAHDGGPKLIGKGARTLPVFLNSSQLWYRSEGLGTVVASSARSNPGICSPGDSAPLIYDITSGTETTTSIDNVYSVWPATSSNF
jgi:hypothetical protein